MLKANMEKTLDLQKIQKFADKVNVDIMVGFAAGLSHVNRDGSTTDTAELAKKLHYGTAEIPARPFLTDGIESQQEELVNEMKTQAQNAVNGKANWNKVGTKAVGAIQELVRGEYYRSNIPNSQMTIEEKGSDTPLIDTGLMINSLSFVVEERKD